MSEPLKSYDRVSALGFPLVPHAHQTAWHYVFDWAVAGKALRCKPGDLVMEFGAGPSYASEWFNRLGYRTVALDLNPEILSHAQERMSLDPRVDPTRSGFVGGDGLRLPLADATLDGVICLNALHHMPDYSSTLSEIRRVIKPGGRAVFSEPGSSHARSPTSRMVHRQFGALERSISLETIAQIAFEVGFERMSLEPCVYPELTELDYHEYELYRLGRSSAPFTRPTEIARFMEESHAIFALTVPGGGPANSALPNVLRARIEVQRLPTAMHAGQRLGIEAKVHNAGDTIWLSEPREFGGQVRFRAKLCLPDGRLLSEDIGIEALKTNIHPGDQATLRTQLRLPDTLKSGDYLLLFDMVAEGVAWFEEMGSPVPEHHFTLMERGEDSGRMRLTRPAVPKARDFGEMTRVVGWELADLGLSDTGEEMLQPIAEAIHSLGVWQQLERDS